MGISNFTQVQKQGRIFMFPLSQELDKKHKLYQLKGLINWDELERLVTEQLKVNHLGRDKRSPRVMIGLMMLQAMYNSSDAACAEYFQENVYWQYFCGYEYVDTKPDMSETAVRRFRHELGEVGWELILAELSRVALESGLCKKKDLEPVT